MKTHRRLGCAALALGPILGIAPASAGPVSPAVLPTSSSSVTLPAIADTYASFVETSTSHGDWPRAFAMQGNENRAYVKFDTRGVVPAGQRVASMSLRVFVIDNLQPKGLRVYAAPSNWQEDTLTMTACPPHWDALASRPVTAMAGQWVDVPLTPDGAYDPNGPSSFEIRNEIQHSSMALATREAGKAPQLTMTFEDAALATQSAQVAAAGSTLLATAASSIQTSPQPTAIAAPAPTAAPQTVTAAASDNQANGESRAFPVPTQNPTGRKVFAHYFTPYPLSLDNLPADRDYYTVNYLNPNGEGGKFAASGGLLRDRPIPRQPLAGNYALADARTELQQAKQSGIDGFTLNLLDHDGVNWRRAQNMLTAADEDGGFTIVPMPDMTTIGWLNPDQMADLVQQVGNHRSAYRLPDGRLVLSPFYADKKNVDYWKATIAALQARGIQVAFMPTFVDWPADAKGFAQISYGFSMWGGRSPANTYDVYASQVKAMGLKWMQPVAVQDQRPVAGVYDEAVNLATLRKSWQIAIDEKADFVQLTTWNDYSEGSTVAPSQAHGWAFLDVSAYYASQFKSGAAPAMKRDSLVITHRKQPHAAMPTTPESILMQLRDNSAPAVDQVEVMSFLTAAGQVTAKVGGTTQTWSAPAGASSQVLPLAAGEISAVVTRGGVQTASVLSPFAVTSSPTVQDLQYVAVSSLR